MKNKILKKLRVIAVLVILLMTTACARLQCDMNIYPNGEYAYQIEIYVPEEFTELNTFNEDSLIAVARTIFKLSENELIKPVNTNVDGINYRGLNIIHERSLPKENGEIKISVDDWNNFLVFELNHEKNNDIWFSLNPLGDADEFIEFIKNSGYEFKITFKMPGEVLETTAGTIDGNNVILNIMNDDFSNLVIKSKVPFLNPIEIAVVLTILVIILIVAYFIYRKHKKEKEVKRVIELKESRKLKVIKEIEPYTIQPDGDVKISEEC